MKSPEKIKKGLECCIEHGPAGCIECPYRDGDSCRSCEKNADALTYIQQLESRLAQTERERDAAISNLTSSCQNCRFVKEELEDLPCKDCLQRNGKFPWSPIVRTKFEWRGICTENTKGASNDG